MKTILVIDDSKFQHRQMARLLDDQEFAIIHALNGAEGLEQLKLGLPDCIITDLIMPVMDGFRFLEVLQEMRVPVPVIVTTADIQQTTRQYCLDLGAHSILHKPIAAGDLLQAIQSALESVGSS